MDKKYEWVPIVSSGSEVGGRVALKSWLPIDSGYGIQTDSILRAATVSTVPPLSCPTVWTDRAFDTMALSFGANVPNGQTARGQPKYADTCMCDIQLSSLSPPPRPGRFVRQPPTPGLTQR